MIGVIKDNGDGLKMMEGMVEEVLMDEEMDEKVDESVEAKCMSCLKWWT